MSRIRSTFDSVTKAVGSADLISKISRFRPGTPTVGGTNVDKLRVKEEPSVSGGGVAEAASSEAAMTSSERDQDRPLEEESEGPRVKEKPFVVTKTPTQGSPSSIASPPSAVAKHTLQLFHPWALSANMDDTYNTLAKHVNGYFGLGVHAHGDNGGVKAAEQEEEDAASEPLRNQASQTTREHVPVLTPVAEAKSKATATTSSVPASTPEAGALTSSPTYPAEESGAPAAPAPATSPKKGFSHCLSYPRPSVQAFVGSYIAPLVPKFRGESKSTTADKEKSPASVPPEEAAEKSEEGKAAEKAKKLLLTQREKIIARVSVDNRTRALVKGLHRVSDVKLLTGRVEELSRHLLEFPETRGVAVKESVLPCLLRLRQARDPPLQASVREALALVGYADPVKGRGIRVLAIDGGGTRGLMALQTLHKLQDLTGKPIHQLFDYICGVSTGAILAFMLAVFQIPLEECEEMYRKLGSDVFKQNVIVGTVKMGWSHAFYDSEVWENLLKERMGEGLMVESARDPNCPKVSAVSTIVNRGLPLKAHVFRNYRLMPGVRSHYLGDCKHKMWQAIRASSAAPGYFQEFVLGKDLHQDGGLLINNPTALAIHECRCLWPNTPLQCVVSLGTGRYETGGRNSTAYTSLRTKITNVISSATNTEEVHTMLDALLPPDTYFRFNPCLSEDIPLDESRLERLDFLKSEGSRYLERNHAKLLKAAAVLKQEKGAIQRLAEWAKLKTEMYDGLPFSSKL